MSTTEIVQHGKDMAAYLALLVEGLKSQIEVVFRACDHLFWEPIIEDDGPSVQVAMTTKWAPRIIVASIHRVWLPLHGIRVVCSGRQQGLGSIACVREYRLTGETTVDIPAIIGMIFIGIKEVLATGDGDSEFYAAAYPVRPEPEAGQRWVHYKGGKYTIINNGKLLDVDHVPSRRCLCYKSDLNNEFWVRTMDDFLSRAEANPNLPEWAQPDRFTPEEM